MILEAIVTTVNSLGQVNLAPMGPVVHFDMTDESFLGKHDPHSSFRKDFSLKPFNTSRTYSNLTEIPYAVIHVTDDALLFAKAAVANLSVDEVMEGVRPLTGTSWWTMLDCHRWFAVEVFMEQNQGERASFACSVIQSKTVRPWSGFNRAKHAVIEAAILATRTHLLGKDDVVSQLERLQPLVDKTGGPDEHQGFDLLKATIHDRYAQRE